MKQKSILVFAIAGLAIIGGFALSQDENKMPYSSPDTEPMFSLLKECCRMCADSVESGPCNRAKYGRGPSGQDCDVLFNLSRQCSEKAFSAEDCRALP